MGKASSLSTKKRLRQSKDRQSRSKANTTRLRSQIKKLRIAAQSGQDTDKLLKETHSVIDRSVKKGVIKKNAAARYKSRLTRLVNESLQ